MAASTFLFHDTHPRSGPPLSMMGLSDGGRFFSSQLVPLQEQVASVS